MEKIERRFFTPCWHDIEKFYKALETEKFLPDIELDLIRRETEGNASRCQGKNEILFSKDQRSFLVKVYGTPEGLIEDISIFNKSLSKIFKSPRGKQVLKAGEAFKRIKEKLIPYNFHLEIPKEFLKEDKGSIFRY